MATIMPSRIFPAWIASTSASIASNAAATMYCSIDVERRKRGCVKNAGRDGAAGTVRMRNDFSQPGRANSSTDSVAFFVHTADKDDTFHPAGETAPRPWTKIRVAAGVPPAAAGGIL